MKNLKFRHLTILESKKNSMQHMKKNKDDNKHKCKAYTFAADFFINGKNKQSILNI